MARLVPIENDVIAMVQLVNMHLISHVVWLGTGQFQWSIGTNGTIGTNGKAPIPMVLLVTMHLIKGT